MVGPGGLQVRMTLQAQAAVAMLLDLGPGLSLNGVSQGTQKLSRVPRVGLDPRGQPVLMALRGEPAVRVSRVPAQLYEEEHDSPHGTLDIAPFGPVLKLD